MIFPTARASTAAHVWMGSIPSPAYARQASPGATVSMTSMNVTPSPVKTEAPARTATAPTNAPVRMVTLDSTVR